MKHFNTFLTVMFLLVLGGNIQSAKAQNSDIDWTQNAINFRNAVNKNVYLYNKTHNGFLNAGGKYGMQAVLNPRGIRLTLRQNAQGFYLEGPVKNESINKKGSCIGIINIDDKIYIDLAVPTEDEPRTAMAFDESGTNTFTIKGKEYQESPTYHYYKYDETHGYIRANGTANNADEWCLVEADDYQNVIFKESEQGRYNISGLILNSRFIRNVVTQESEAFWSTKGLKYESDDYCTSIDPKMGTEDSNDGYASEFGAFGCLEMGHVEGRFYQIISGLRPGLYAVTAQAFFDTNDKCTYKGGAYSTDNPAEASNAYLYANDAETRIPTLPENDYNTFKRYVDEQYNSLTNDGETNDKQYFRRNVPAAYFLAQGNQFSPDETFHRVTTYVTVTANEGSATGSLELGVRKDAVGGRVYVDNISLYYIGNEDEHLSFGVDAYGDESSVDTYTYEKEYYFKLSRKFNLNQWSALTLPVDLTGQQVKEAFGDEVELCKLYGENPDNHNQILFTPVDIDNTYNAVIEANMCYLVKVKANAKFNENARYTFNKRNEADPQYGRDPEKVTYDHGYIYEFTGVRCPEGIKKQETKPSPDGKLYYTYFNYHPEYAPKGSYVMSGGRMYHLTDNWDSLIGTAWYITEANQSQGSLTFVIDNGNGTTDINGIVTETPAGKAAEGVYTINGQKVASDKSLNDLPKGIYIVNGKKYIVR